MKTACSKRNHGLANIWNKFLSYITTGNLLFAFFLFMSQDNQPTIDGLMDLSGGACGDRGIRVRKGGGKPIPLPHTSIYNIFWSNWQNGTTHPVEKHGATERLSHFRSFKLELCIAYTYNLDEFCFALVLPHFTYVHGFHQIWPHTDPPWSLMRSRRQIVWIQPWDHPSDSWGWIKNGRIKGWQKLKGMVACWIEKNCRSGIENNCCSIWWWLLLFIGQFVSRTEHRHIICRMKKSKVVKIVLLPNQFSSGSARKGKGLNADSSRTRRAFHQEKTLGGSCRCTRSLELKNLAAVIRLNLNFRNV